MAFGTPPPSQHSTTLFAPGDLPGIHYVTPDLSDEMEMRRLAVDNGWREATIEKMVYGMVVTNVSVLVPPSAFTALTA